MRDPETGRLSFLWCCHPQRGVFVRFCGSAIPHKSVAFLRHARIWSTAVGLSEKGLPYVRSVSHLCSLSGLWCICSDISWQLPSKWRNVNDSNIRRVSPNLGLAIRCLTISANAPCCSGFSPACLLHPTTHSSRRSDSSVDLSVCASSLVDLQPERRASKCPWHDR